jgi:glycosyltransferase involved in cell wall biosynthesis
MAKEKILISTLSPGGGGVNQMVRFLAECLKERDYVPLLAYYEPYSITPEFSVPSTRLMQRTIGTRSVQVLNGFEAHAIGAWLPELEFTHYWPTRHWKELIRSCSYHISVSGNCLPSTPFALTDTRFLAWVATPWHEDRKDRVKHLPFYRKLLDTTIIRKIIPKLEKRILTRGTILALSEYTLKKLNNLAQKDVTHDVLPKPVDLKNFKPASDKVIPGRIGFVGRIDDPRKNIGLLIQAINICRNKGYNISAEIIGGEPNGQLESLVQSMKLRDAVTFIKYLESSALPEHLKTFDIFAVPSHQEGLCIAALEAMACGSPVISTRCGGPEEFVINGETGFLVNPDPVSLTDAIIKVFIDRDLRSKLSDNARMMVENRYQISLSKEKFWSAFHKTFNAI